MRSLRNTAFQDEGSLLILGVDTTGDQQLREYEFDRSQTQIADPLTYLARAELDSVVAGFC